MDETIALVVSHVGIEKSWPTVRSVIFSSAEHTIRVLIIDLVRKNVTGYMIMLE